MPPKMSQELPAQKIATLTPSSEIAKVDESIAHDLSFGRESANDDVFKIKRPPAPVGYEYVDDTSLVFTLKKTKEEIADQKYLLRPSLSPGFKYVGKSSTITSYPDDPRLAQVKLDKHGRPIPPVGYEYASETGLEFVLTEAREEREKRDIR